MDFPILPLDSETSDLSEISFEFEDVEIVFPDHKLIENWFLECSVTEEKAIGALTFVFCTDAYLLELNVKYLDHHTLTDVITFPFDEQKIDGDIFISVDRVRENADKEGVSFLNEVYRVMVHGVLHLAGYTDKTPAQKQEMRERENFYLSKLPDSAYN